MTTAVAAGDGSEICAVVVNFRTAQLSIECLESVLPEMARVNGRVVIVDNASGDGSADAISAWISEGKGPVELIRSPVNRGFAGGNNLGMSHCPACFYLLVNSDARLLPGSVERLLRTAAEEPRAMAISPRLEGSDGVPQQSCFRFRTPLTELLAVARTGPLDRIFQRHVVAMPVQRERVRVDWTSFACVLLRHAALAEVGMLDEGYFMYFEDEELCRRARRRGWHVVHDPAARAVHLRGRSSPVKSLAIQRKRLPRYFHESRTRFFHQSYGRLGLTCANLLWWAGRAVAFVRQLAGSKNHAAIESQWRDIWINWWRPGAPYTPPR